jgi:protein ATS1
MMPFCLYALGSNGSGQLGIGHTSDVFTPQECIFDPEAVMSPSDKISDIKAGGNHTLVLTSSGQVFAAGNYNALPSPCSQDRHFRSLDMAETFGLTNASKMTSIATTWEASFFVADGQVVYACGKGSKGELGLGETISEAQMPRVVLDLGIYRDGTAVIQTIAAGMSHVVLTTSDGEIYGWGAARKGQLGEEAINKKTVWSPRKVSVGLPPKTVVAGRDFTFIQGNSGEQVLLGEKKHFPDDTIAQLSGQPELFAGWSNLYALQSGALHAVGRSDRGQLSAQALPKLLSFAAGSEHGVGYTFDGEVVAFGWGEHGNCGEPVDERGNVIGRFNHIKLPALGHSEVSFLAAGCATTFVAVSPLATPD